MELLINVFCLIFSGIVASAYIFFSFARNTLYLLRVGLLLFPLIEFVRRIVLIGGEEITYPFLIILTQMCLRLIGPFFNWHIHLQLGKRINWLHPLNLIMYGMMLYNIYYAVILMFNYETEFIKNVLNQLTGANFYTIGYSLIQLGYFIHAIWILLKNKAFSSSNRLIYFMRTILIIISISLVIQQCTYLFFDIYTVDFIITPLIISSIYASLIFISVKTAGIHSGPNPDSSSVLQIRSLSNREKEVLEMLSQGKTDKEIAYELDISTGTVNTYCKRIYHKLEVNNRTEAANVYNSYA